MILGLLLSQFAQPSHEAVLIVPLILCWLQLHENDIGASDRPTIAFECSGIQ